MAVKIKLARIGKIRQPFYRVVVADSRTSGGGRAIERVGRYQPKAEPSLIEIDSERVQYWLGVGAQPTESVLALLKVTGDWQKFKGLPGAEGTLKPQPEKVSKRERYDAAIAALGGDDGTEAATPKKKTKKAADSKPDAKTADAKTAAKPDEKAAKTSDDTAAAKSDDKADTKAAKKSDDTAADAGASGDGAAEAKSAEG